MEFDRYKFEICVKSLCTGDLETQEYVKLKYLRQIVIVPNAPHSAALESVQPVLALLTVQYGRCLMKFHPTNFCYNHSKVLQCRHHIENLMLVCLLIPFVQLPPELPSFTEAFGKDSRDCRRYVSDSLAKPVKRTG